jgi:hypothetical protein
MAWCPTGLKARVVRSEDWPIAGGTWATIHGPRSLGAILMDERAWFRLSGSAPWHVVEARDDLYLNALCGYARPWARSQQTRAATMQEPACLRCLAGLRAPIRRSVRRAKRPPIEDRLRAIADAIPPGGGSFRVLARSGDGSTEAVPGDATRWFVERTAGNIVEIVFSSEDADGVAAFLASRVVNN